VTELLVAIPLGAAAGILSGMFGVGGGVVIVPALIFVLGFDPKTATGTSLAALLLPVAIFAVISYAHAGHVNFRVAIPLAICLAIAAPFGAKIALSMSSRTLAQVFGIFLALVAIRLIAFPPKG
jgi:uncharacterized membrane protein YfcA